MSSDLAYTLVGAFGIFFMGIIVYFHDKKSISNALFFFISLATVFWSLANYFSISVESDQVLIWVRLVLFFAVPHAALFSLFVYNFPNRELKINKISFGVIMVIMVFAMLATISPFVFSGINIINDQAVPIVGPLMPFFALVVISSLFFALITMTVKYVRAKDSERIQWRSMLVGVSISYILLILTNFILVVIWGNTFFVKFGPLFMLPAILGMGYAIIKHHLLNVKAIATEFLTFSILSISLFEVISSKSFTEVALRTGVFCLFFIFGIFLIRSVLKEVEQREKLEILSRELGVANEKLKELDHLKSEFLSFASHQIKAPLAAIKGFATLIYDGTYGESSDKVKEAAVKIKDSSDKMVQLVTDFLNVRKIEEGKMEYKLERIDGIKVIREIFEELKPIAQNKKLEFNLDAGNEIWINADIQRIRQVFQNLIENSIKYTDSGFVKIKAELKDNKLLFSVSDSGHGISKDLLSHLFEEFKRDGKEKKIEGTGLGLYIAKDIVEAHHGRVWVESEGTGKGSAFFVEIPLS